VRLGTIRIDLQRARRRLFRTQEQVAPAAQADPHQEDVGVRQAAEGLGVVRVGLPRARSSRSGLVIGGGGDGRP
jgi:hypothetical protein